MQDIEANMTYLQIGVLAAGLILALVGFALVLRACNTLNEVREAYWRGQMQGAPERKPARVASAPAINAASARRKIRSNRIRGVL